MGAQTEPRFVPETVVAHGLGMSASGVTRVIERGSAAATAADGTGPCGRVEVKRRIRRGRVRGRYDMVREAVMANQSPRDGGGR